MGSKGEETGQTIEEKMSAVSIDDDDQDHLLLLYIIITFSEISLNDCQITRMELLILTIIVI